MAYDISSMVEMSTIKPRMDAAKATAEAESEMAVAMCELAKQLATAAKGVKIDPEAFQSQVEALAVFLAASRLMKQV